MTIEKVVIIIPTYNEALVIEDTLTQVFQATSAITAMDIHVLVFDSNSTDTTQAIVSRLQTVYENLHLQTEPQKTGLGAAYLQAMRYALNELAADIIIEFDSDCSHQPKYIAPVLEKLKTVDVVVGSRYIRGGSIPKNWGLHRKFLSGIGNMIARFLLTRKYHDFTSGFRATRRQAALQALPANFLSDHYAYKLEFLWLLHKNQSLIEEYPIEFVDREKGQSKLPRNSIIDSLRVLLTLRFRESRQYVNMCFVGVSGAILQCLIYNVLRQSMTPFNAAQFSVVAAMFSNFTVNNCFVFKRKLGTNMIQKLTSLGLFIGYSALMVNMQSYWLSMGIRILGQGYLKENIIVMIGIILGSFLNYRSYSRIIWKSA